MLQHGLALLVIVAITAGDTNKAFAEESRTAAQLYTQICAACHGAKGEGRFDAQTPSIGGLPAWHTANQFAKFREGLRGAHPEDHTGQVMRAIALSIPENEIAALCEHVAKLPKHLPDPTGDGDVKRGRDIYEDTCMACHRFNASGERVFGSPPLTHLQAWYITAQVNKYRNGIRGYDPKDEHGRKMALATSHLLSDEDVTSLVAFIQTLWGKYK